jgi:hypothetical protein
MFFLFQCSIVLFCLGFIIVHFYALYSGLIYYYKEGHLQRFETVISCGF